MKALVDDPAGSLREILQFIGSQAAIPSDAELRANPPAAAHRIPGHAVISAHVAVPAHFAVPSHVISQKPIHAHGVESFRKFEAVAPNLFAEIRPLLAPLDRSSGLHRVSAAADTLQPGQRRVTLADALAEIAAFERENKLAEASDLANRVLYAAPEHPHVLHMAGIVSYRQGRFDEAISRMEKSVRLAPDIALYPRNMCEIYRSTGRLDAALTSGRRAVELSPADSRAHFNLALIHYERLELDAAVSVAEKALELDPDFAEAHFEKAEALLLSGQLAAGWESYEWRFKLKQAEGMLPKTDKPQWNGEALAPGRLLIIADQGLGDCIQFSRLIPWVTQLAPTPILACSHDLVPILRQLPGLSKIVTSWDQTGAYDCYIPLSGLPRLAGITTENIPNSGAYLNVDPQQTAAWRDKLERLAAPGKRRIALVWAGRPSHKNDRKRTLKLSQFAPLFSIPGSP